MKCFIKITPIFRADFAGIVMTPNISIQNIEIYLSRCHSFPIRRNSVTSGFQFINQSNFYSLTSKTGHRKGMIVNQNVAAESPDAKDIIYPLHTAGYHQRRGGEG